ncbi:hypothetical protein D8674_018180 [Pyrus ussuriensis x Pyrus communis]|uniref:Uncharacterized protein n=1 Tax=Pyrus ussuriensis x Pyrus communis TaxID=2448454 RepID=A0A5N5G4H7_9ROSA|nr:hypothetical protein D8674_018180 [Pyrus ussuriensis x Pyrus communis]
MESAAAWVDAQEWEVCNDDGFVFKRRKRRRVDPDADSSASAPPSSSAADLREDHEKLRRERRRNFLLKLRDKYQAEIDQWELLSSMLRAMEGRARQLQQQREEEQQQRTEEEERQKTASSDGPSALEIQGSDSGCGSLVDELLLQVDAHAAIIRDVSSLCDTADALYNEEEEQISPLFFDIPICSSPRELMRSLQW